MNDTPIFGMPPIAPDAGPQTPPSLPPRYVGWLRRVGAYLIDMLIFGAPMFVWLWSTRNSVSGMMTQTAVAAIITPVLRIELLRRFGGTPGKRLLGFHVTAVDGSPIGYKHAFIRESVTTLLSVVMSVNLYMKLAAIHTVEGATWNYFDPANNGLQATSMDSLLLPLNTIWVLLDFVIMVTNSQFRALHDKMAGTVAVMDDKPRNSR